MIDKAKSRATVHAIPVNEATVGGEQPPASYHIRKVVTECIPVKLNENGSTYGQILDQLIHDASVLNEEIQSIEFGVTPEEWFRLSSEIRRNR